VPVNSTVKVPAAAGAEKVTDWVTPGESVSGVAGAAEMPFGNPLRLTVTGPENPFTGVSETTTG
jgi:hypothetical protein